MQFDVKITEDIANALRSGDRRVKSAMKSGVRAAIRVIKTAAAEEALKMGLKKWTKPRGNHSYITYVDVKDTKVIGKLEARYPGELIMRGRNKPMNVPTQGTKGKRMREWLAQHPDVKFDPDRPWFPLKAQKPRPFLINAGDDSQAAAEAAFAEAFWARMNKLDA